MQSWTCYYEVLYGCIKKYVKFCEHIIVPASNAWQICEQQALNHQWQVPFLKDPSGLETMKTWGRWNFGNPRIPTGGHQTQAEQHTGCWEWKEKSPFI